MEVEWNKKKVRVPVRAESLDDPLFDRKGHVPDDDDSDA